MIRARGRSPSALALSSSIHSTAAAPSEICDDVPAVWMPPSITGFSAARPSSVVSRSPWSRVTNARFGRRLLLLVEHRRLDRADLTVEPALGPGLLGLALRLEAPLVDVLAGDAAALGDPLGGGELVGQVDVPRRRPQHRAVGPCVGAEPDHAHRLDAAGDADVDGARRDQAGDQVVGLLSAAALAVHGGGADVFRQTRDQPCRPG